MGKRLEHKIIQNVEHKFCSSCEQWLELNQFDNSIQTWDNKHGRCKVCQKQYYIKHKQERLQKQIIYHKNNRSIRCTKMRDYYSKNIQKFKAYYTNNKASFYLHAKNSNRRRRAIKKEVHCDKIDCVELLNIFNSVCAYCNISIDINNMTIDHVLSLEDGGNHDMWNVVPSCKSCNCSKRHVSILDWYPKQEFFIEENLFKILEHCKL